MENLSKYDCHVKEVIQEAKELDRKYSSPWVLSRGHDLTTMITHYMNKRTGKTNSVSKIERYIRLACEFDDFMKTPMYDKMRMEGMIKEKI